MDWLYLDNNATTRPADAVARAMTEAHETLWANPSSAHRFGQQVRQRLELARASVAQLIGGRPREIIFTSGGTESNNLALQGLLRPALQRGGPATLITAPVEHAAIREPGGVLEEAGTQRVLLPVDSEGRIDVAALVRELDERVTGGGLTLVSVQWANNETGVIQPIEEVAAAVADARQIAVDAGAGGRVYLHTDATQAVGKLPVDVASAGVDLLTLAGHKFHGPKGVGALWVRTGVRPAAELIGGPQERGRRGGTENVPAVVGLGVAADLAATFLADASKRERLALGRDQFEAAICAAVPETQVNSAAAPRLWNTSNLAFPRLEAEAILLGLSERGLCASAGAACSSGSLEPSPILLAMGLPEPVAHGSVRFSLSRFTTDAEIQQAIAIVPEVVRRVGAVLPIGEP
jgi:cysteine desulfurase